VGFDPGANHLISGDTSGQWAGPHPVLVLIAACAGFDAAGFESMVGQAQ
jgi:hypothetical protein